MKSINAKKQEVVSAGLKYCELCGALWLRSAACDAIYCPRCVRVVQQLAPRLLPQLAADRRPQ